MSEYYNVVVPLDGNEDKSRFRRVGVMFKNTRNTGETYYKLQLDFPVGVTELLCFPPRDDNADA
ncbi:MAG: hypothetical protein OXC62_06385 [Aestuariivita sp.]|nr:hypothetical protein [Aestuariivita sp.]